MSSNGNLAARDPSATEPESTCPAEPSLPPGTWSRIVGRACCLALLILQPVFFFWHVLVNPTAHIPFDIGGFHLPLISYIGQCVRSGVAPLWDPYPYCGAPIHADSQAQVFYPFTWLAVLAGNHTQGHNLFYWVQALVPLHMILAGLFTYLLLRRMELCRPAALFGASVFQLGGFFASQAQHLGAICSAPWLPLAILAVFELRFRLRARWIAALGIAVAMSILAGFAAATVVVGGAVLLVVLSLLAFRDASWRIVPGVAAGFLAGAAIAAVQLVPLWQLSRLSMAALRGTWYTTGGGLTAHTLVSLIIPNYYHIFELGAAYKLPYNFTYLYAYCGIATAVLLVLAPFIRNRRAILFLILTVLSVFWMLGEHTPVYPAIFMHLPALLRGALYAEYALLAFCCFAAITAAIVLHHAGKRLPIILVWAIALYTGYDLIRTGHDKPMNAYPGGYKTGDFEYASAGCAAPGCEHLAPKLRSLVNQTTPPSRIEYTDTLFSIGIHASEMLRLPTANGDNPFVLLRMLRLRRLFTSGNTWERQLTPDRPGSPLLRMLNVEWIVGATPISEDQAGKAGLEPVELVDGFHIYRNTRVLPRFFFVPRIRRSPGETETLRRLAEESFDPAEEAVVEGISQGYEQLAAGEVKVESYSPNRTELAVQSRGPGFLATSEPMYPGWTARVNGRPQPLYQTNGAFRGLFLPAGPSRVVMEYHPQYFVLSASLSLAALLAAMVAIFWGVRPPRLVAALALWGRRLPPARAGGNRLPHSPWPAGPAAPGLGSAPETIDWPLWARRKVQTLWTSWVVPRRSTLGSLGLLFSATVLFYWKILLTRQFSLLTESEGVSQAYSWLKFWTGALRHFVLPLWDPYTLAGHSFAGEMQTGAFYPLHLILALFPPSNAGFSPNLYHSWFAFTHFLAACFMFALVRELGLGRFAALVAGLCFSLGGFVGHMPWPHMLESSIWLPLLFLFFLRALRQEERRLAILNSAAGGLILGMSILAGGMHVVIMQVLTILLAAIYHAFTGDSRQGVAGDSGPWFRRRSVERAAMVVAIIGGVGLAAGAVQLLPSIEYSNHAIRFLGKPGALPANQKIPYADLSDGLWPSSFVAMLIPQAFNGNMGGGEPVTPYLGVFPLLLAIIGLWRNWRHRWVRYLGGLAFAGFLYALGSFSPLHGLLYALAPRLWMAREAGRIVYLIDFAFSILAAFGLETLWSSSFRTAPPAILDRILKALVIACAAALFVPAVYGRPGISPWVGLSILLIFVSYGLFRSIVRGNIGTPARLLVVSLILFDLAAFDWSARNLQEVARTGTNHLDRLLSCRGAVNFLKSREGQFRVAVAADPKPNIGDFFGIQTTSGAGATLPVEFARIMAHPDLLNVRYRLAPASTTEPGPVYWDFLWRVYENPNALPRAWIVHEAIVAPTPERAFAELEKPGFDPWRTAILDAGAALEPYVEGSDDAVAVRRFEPNRIELEVRAKSRGMVVLSEMFYPGWRATVNGNSARIFRADGALRGILAPSGESRIVLEYAPGSVYFGALLTFATFLGVLAGFVAYGVRRP